MELLNQKQASVLFKMPRATLSTKIKRLKVPSDGGTPSRPLFKKETLLKYFPINKNKPKHSTIFAIATIKGGEFKSSITQYLGQALSIKGKKVLLVDLDPQSNLSSNYVDYAENSISDLMGVTGNRNTFDNILIQYNDKLHILPSNIKLSAFNQTVKISDYKRLKNILDPIRSRYDIILIDTGPSLSPLLDNALVACDQILVPVKCRQYSILGLDMLVDAINDIRENLNPNLEIMGGILAGYEKREVLNELLDEIKSHFNIFNTPILHRKSIPQNQVTKENLFDTKPNDSKMFLDLADEIIEKIK